MDLSGIAAPAAVSSLRTAGRRLDPILTGLGVGGSACTLWSLAGPGFGGGRGTVGWALQVSLDLILGLLCRRVVALPQLTAPMPRFWRTLAGVAWLSVVADTYATAMIVFGPADVTQPDTVQTVIAGAAVAWLVWAMLTYPLGAVGRERTRLWLDAATVLTGAAVFAWVLIVGGPAAPTGSSAIASRLLTSGMMLVAAFALSKLMFSHQAPLTLWSGSAGALAATLFGVATYLATNPAGTGRPGLTEALRLVPCFLAAAIPRIQELQLRTGTALHTQRRHRSYNVFPYFMVAATLALLAFQLGRAGITPQNWGIVAGTAAITFVVVARQVLALADNDRLVTDLDAGMDELRRLTDQVAEEKSLLSGVISTIPHLVYWKDTNRRYQGCNQAFVTVRGLAPDTLADAVAGCTEPELALAAGHGADELGALLLTLEDQVLARGAPVLAHKATFAGPDGATRVLLLSILPHLDPEGVVGGVIGVGADISEIAWLERQLAQASRLESIGQLAAGIAHEINTPVQYVTDNTRFVADSLNPLLRTLRAGQGDGAVALLTEHDVEFLATEVPDALSQSLEGLARVASIVSAMKDFAHPGQERAPCDLNRAVRSTVEVARSEWKHVAQVTLDLGPELEQITCHEGEIKQALLNVLVNAAHALAAQRTARASDRLGQIIIRTRRAGDEVTIEVSDDGPGIPEAIRSRVFDPFFTTKPVGTGTGQGLAIAHGIIVTRHKGAVDLESEPGQGTTFRLRFPAPPEDGASGHPAGRQQPAAATS